MILLKLPLWPALALLAPCLIQAQTLTWDAATGSAGVQNGSGTWNLSNSNWWDGSSNVSWVNGTEAIAQFGTPTPVSANTVTVEQDIQLKELRFLSVTAATIASGQQYSLNGNTAGRVIDFGANGRIQMADLSSGGSQFVSLGANLTLKGSDLRLQKFGEGTAFQFLTLGMAANAQLTGAFTIGGSIYATVNNPNTLQAVDRIAVEAGGSAALGGANADYTQPFHLAGFGNSLGFTGTAYGAIRFTTANTRISGPVTLTADAGVHTNSSGANGLSGMVISGAISDGGAGFAFHRFALGRGNGTLALAGPNSYGGSTVLGRAQTGYSGGITILDFTAATAPQDDILYHGLMMPGALDLIGGNSASVLRLTGRDGQVHHQRFGDLTVSGTHSVIDLQAGSGGGMNLSAGGITRSGNATLTVSGPVAGAFTTTQADGFLGPWLSYQTAAGTRSWAQVQGGVLGAGFAGEVEHVTGGLLDASPYAGAHVGLTSASVGEVSQGSATAFVQTLSMNDVHFDRQVPIGLDRLLRFGATGGVQIVAGARNLTLGMADTASLISAGGATTNTAGQLFLSNHSDSSVLTVHSRIANNGTGVVTLLVNGAPGSRTVLTAANTHTGGTVIASGLLEIRNAAALGSTGTVTVVDGATLALSGGLTLTRTLTAIGGFGDGGLGGLRSLADVNVLAAQVTQAAPTFLTADAGAVLRLERAAATDIVLAGGYTATFGGAGTVEVNSRISISSSGIVKTGNGLLVLAGDNNFTGTVTISQGALRVRHANALGVSGSSFSSTTVSAGGALEIEGGITLAAEPVTLASAGVNNGGGIRNVGGDNTTTGVITLNATTQRIHSDAGLLTLGGAGNATLHSSSSARTLIFGGAGDILVARPLARTGSGAFTVTKEGSGMLTLAAAVANSATVVNAGVMKLDFAGAASPASQILGSTATLSLGGGRLVLSGRAGTVNSQTTGTLTVGGSYSELEFDANGASSLTLTVGDLARSFGGILVVGPHAAGALRSSGGTGVADVQALINDGRVFAVLRDPVQGDDWAGTTALSGGLRQVVGLAALGINTPSTADALTGHADIAAGVMTTTLSAETTVSSLRFAAAQATTIAQAGSQILNAGGILVSSTVGAHDSIIAAQVRPTASTVSNPDLVIVQNNPLGSLIFQNGIVNRTETGRTTVSVVKAGPGRVVIGGTSTFSGNLRVYEGEVQFAAGSAVGSAMEFLLGSGARSGRVTLGSAAGTASLLIDYIATVGTGTDNRIVGGASGLSRLTLTGSVTTPSNFANGFLGGPGTNENQLEFRLASLGGLVTLGPDNTYAGATILSRGTIEVARLADSGQSSSLGTGSLNPVIQMGDATTSAVGSTAIAVLRHIGAADSVTNRALNLTNSDVAAEITKVSAVLESVGEGTVKFTAPFTVGGSNPVGRVLELGGSNTGMNEVVGIGQISAANATSLVKAGTGTWAVTGASLFSGGTQVQAGRLLVTNSSGSATGLGPVTVAAGAMLGGTGRIAPAADADISLTGATLQVGLDLQGEPATAAALTLHTAGSGSTRLLDGSVLALDLIFGAGWGDQSTEADAADRLIVGGTLSLGDAAVLRVGNPNRMDTWSVGDAWRLFDWTTLSGTAEGTFTTFELPVLPAGLVWDTSGLFDQGTLAIAFVPEPGRTAFIGLGLLFWLLRRKRRE
jgi:fibronectin-binding autotransporter adhesin